MPSDERICYYLHYVKWTEADLIKPHHPSANFQPIKRMEERVKWCYDGALDVIQRIEKKLKEKQPELFSTFASVFLLHSYFALPRPFPLFSFAVMLQCFLHPHDLHDHLFALYILLPKFFRAWRFFSFTYIFKLLTFLFIYSFIFYVYWGDIG